MPYMQKTFIHTNIIRLFSLAMAIGIMGAGVFYSSPESAKAAEDRFCYSISDQKKCTSFTTANQCRDLCNGASGSVYPDGVCTSECPKPPSGGGSGSTGGGIELPNPIQSQTFADLVQKIAKVFTAVGIPLVAIFLIYAGFLFVTAQGSEDKLKTAKTTFFWAIVGGAIVIGAYAIATAVVNFAIKL